MTAPASPGIRRRWRRFVLRTQGRLDGERSDQVLPWAFAVALFAVLLALHAAALRSLAGGSGLAPWLQAAWRVRHGGAGRPMAGTDPVLGAWSFVALPVLELTRVVPALAVFALVQAAAIGLGVVPLWRLAREEAHLRVGAAVAIVVTYALAPTLHRTNLSAFHPEVIALPALLWACLHARRQRDLRFWCCIALVLACRADLGLTVAALGLVLVVTDRRRLGIPAAILGTAWTALALVVIRPTLPDGALTPAGEFVARATTPLAEVPQAVAHPWSFLTQLVAEPSVLFLVVVFSPLLFLPLVAPRRLLPALPCLALAMVADQAVQASASEGVLSLSPAAAHVAPAMAFAFLALVFALARIGTLSVVRVNVDRRVLAALLVGAVLLFVTEAPTSPYRSPWRWGGRDEVDQARVAATEDLPAGDAVAASPSVSALVAERATVVELPPDPEDLTRDVLRRTARRADVVVLDTTGTDPRTDDPVWTGADRRRVVGVLLGRGFEVVSTDAGIYRLERDA